MAKNSFLICFWGVRGSMAVPGINTLRYGGNTACVEMRCGDRTLIFDAGTGIYQLGLQRKLMDFNIFLSHTHLDHIMGFPMFGPCFDKKASIRLWSGHLDEIGTLKKVFLRLLSSPIFLPLKKMPAAISFKQFSAGENIVLGNITIKTIRMIHPDHSTGYRVEYNGKSVCYLTDVSYRVNKKRLVKFAKGADVMIFDSTYSNEEQKLPKHRVHSTWQEGAEIAEAAGVKKFIAFHHDPLKTDIVLDGVAKKLAKKYSGAILAREGLEINI